jgi:hypothetical protein
LWYEKYGQARVLTTNQNKTYMKQTALEWLEENLIGNPHFESDFIHNRNTFKQAKEMEETQQRQKLISLLDWMNKVAQDNPMVFETDSDDIVDMYLEG